MGQAKNRGTFDERKAQAIAAGRRPIGDIRREAREKLDAEMAQAAAAMKQGIEFPKTFMPLSERVARIVEQQEARRGR